MSPPFLLPRFAIVSFAHQFKRKVSDDASSISALEFADMLVAYSQFSPKKTRLMRKRVKKYFKDKPVEITLGEYLEFFHFLNNINDVDTALTFYHIAGASVDQGAICAMYHRP
jgi:hypothetical protein